MVVIYVQEIGQVTKAKHKLLPALWIQQETRLDVTIRSKGSTTSPPSSDSHQLSLFKLRNFSLADLASCVNLKKLEIESLECWTGVAKFLEAIPATPAMLDRLTINRGNFELVQQLCDTRLPDGKSIIDFSSLKKIVATVERLDTLKELFVLCGNLHKIALTSMSLLHLISSSI